MPNSEPQWLALLIALAAAELLILGFMILCFAVTVRNFTRNSKAESELPTAAEIASYSAAPSTVETPAEPPKPEPDYEALEVEEMRNLWTRRDKHEPKADHSRDGSKLDTFA